MKKNLSSLLTLLAAVPGSALVAQGPTDYLAYWDFDENAGSVLLDRTGGGSDGAITGASWVSGVSGSALAFDGMDDAVLIENGGGPPADIGALAEGTISLWIWIDRVPSSDEIFPLLELGDGLGGPGRSALVLEVGHDQAESRVFFTLFSDDAVITQCFNSLEHLASGTWYHFAAVVGPDGNTGFLNGEELTDRRYNFGTADDHEFFADVADQQVFWLARGFQGENPTPQFLEGRLDELRIYDRPLDAAEIESLWLEHRSDPPPLVLAKPTLLAGTAASLQVSGGTPSGLTAVFFSLTGLHTHLLRGGSGEILDLRSPEPAAPAGFADATGSIAWSVPVPPAALGRTVFLQALRLGDERSVVHQVEVE